MTDRIPGEEESLPTENEREQGFFERHFGFRAWKFLAALAGVVMLGMYISDLLFGDASLEVLMQIEGYERHLKEEISRLKQENARLQKEYFELRELDADSASR